MFYEHFGHEGASEALELRVLRAFLLVGSSFCIKRGSPDARGARSEAMSKKSFQHGPINGPFWEPFWDHFGIIFGVRFRSDFWHRFGTDFGRFGIPVWVQV